jgi:hypothetical protein
MNSYKKKKIELHNPLSPQANDMSGQIAATLKSDGTLYYESSLENSTFFKKAMHGSGDDELTAAEEYFSTNTPAHNVQMTENAINLQAPRQEQIIQLTPDIYLVANADIAISSKTIDNIRDMLKQ